MPTPRYLIVIVLLLVCGCTSSSRKSISTSDLDTPVDQRLGPSDLDPLAKEREEIQRPDVIPAVPARIQKASPSFTVTDAEDVKLTPQPSQLPGKLKTPVFEPPAIQRDKSLPRIIQPIGKTSHASADDANAQRAPEPP